MKPKRIYLNRVEGDGSDKIWSEEPVSVCDYVQNGEYINLSQVWHDASEEPKCGKAILCLNKKGSINLLTNNNKLIYTLTQMDAGVINGHTLMTYCRSSSEIPSK